MSTINGLMASMREHDIESPKSKDIRDMIIDSLIAEDECHDNCLGETVIKLLCAAHTVARREEADVLGKKLDTFVKGERAERFFRKAAITAYKEEFPDEPDNSENIPEWPDSLPTDLDLSCNLLTYAGYIIGHRTATNSKHLYDYCQSQAGIMA